MSIDWFTLVAQIINFLLLVWLLKRFLYKPILDAIDAREELVASQIKDAKVQLEKAEKEQQMFQNKNETFDKKRSELTSSMEKEVADEKLKATDAVRKEIELLRIKLEENLKSQQANFRKVFMAESQKNFFSIAQRMLKHLATEELEDQMINVFIQVLKNTAPDVKDKFVLALKATSDPVIVRSAFELNAVNKKKIEDTIAEEFIKGSTFQYFVSPDQISGVELSSRDYKFSWTIAEYLKTLENNTMELLNSKNEVNQPIG